jgi:hypothetical protein
MGKQQELKLKAIQELKQTTRGNLIPVGDSGNFARIHIHSRGEEVFYHEGDRALLFTTEALYDKAVAMRKIKRWDNNDKVTDEERAEIIQRIAEYLRNHGWTDPPPGWK